MQKIRVLVVDDHTIVRDGICALLALAGDIEVVGEATNGNEALEKVKELNPDVVLMDIAMPIMGGLEATRRISKEFPKTQQGGGIFRASVRYPVSLSGGLLPVTVSDQAHGGKLPAYRQRSGQQGPLR